MTYPFRCVMVPTEQVLKLLDKNDPRLININDVLVRVTRTATF
jgi:hypothetical protein